MKHVVMSIIVWMFWLRPCVAADMPPEYAWLVDEVRAPYLEDPLVVQASGRHKAQVFGLLGLAESSKPDLVATNARIAAELFRLDDAGDSAVLEDFLKDHELRGQLRKLFEIKGASSVSWLISRYSNLDVQQRAAAINCMVGLAYQEVYEFLIARLDEKTVVPSKKADAYEQVNNRRMCDIAYSVFEISTENLRRIPLPPSVPKDGTSPENAIEERDSSILALKAAWVENSSWKIAVTNVPSRSHR